MAVDELFVVIWHLIIETFRLREYVYGNVNGNASRSA